MHSQQLLTQQAITASSNGKWNESISLNEQVLAEEPNDVAALNRLAFAYMQLGNMKKARQTYEKVLTIEKYNVIAQKYLGLLKKKVKPVVNTPQIGAEDFIEEPGKTKSVSLTRLADPDKLQATAVGTACKLVVKTHRINVVTQDGTYLGCLPDDIAHRLQKLISCGNQYSVRVQSTTKKSCIVFLKETFRSENCPFATSFVNTNTTRTHLHHDDVLLDETPLDIGDAEVDTEEMETTDDASDSNE